MNIPVEEKPEIPPYIQDGKPLIRGTPAWIEREKARKAAGCKVVDYYELPASWSWVGTKPRNSGKKL